MPVEHPSRAELYEELHSRPPPVVETPCVITHLAIQIREGERETEHAHLVRLCERFDCDGPHATASCFYPSLGEFELRWERHTEFSTYTFIREVDEASVWNARAVGVALADWMEAIPGRTIVALHLAFSEGSTPPDRSTLDRYFEGQPVFGGGVRQGTGSLYSTFRLADDGFGRVAVHGQGLTAPQAGRLVQRVLEIETYRLMALLALPIARQITPSLTEMEQTLAQLNQRLTHAVDETGQQRLLEELSTLAAGVERLRSDTNYRFAATNAYYGLVNERLAELHGTKIPGLQAVHVFMQRRLAPGIRTCNAVRDRLEGLSRRISQASNLLRTRVELSIQSQNRELLSSMNRRGEIQLRLQQAVEGLSVVALTYYVISLLSYLYDGLHFLPLPKDKKLVLAMAIPIVALVVWRGIHGVSRSIHGPSGESHD